MLRALSVLLREVNVWMSRNKIEALIPPGNTDSLETQPEYLLNVMKLLTKEERGLMGNYLRHSCIDARDVEIANGTDYSEEQDVWGLQLGRAEQKTLRDEKGSLELWKEEEEKWRG